MDESMTINEFERSYQKINQAFSLQNKIIKDYERELIQLYYDKRELENEVLDLKKRISVAINTLRSLRESFQIQKDNIFST